MSIVDATSRTLFLDLVVLVQIPQQLPLVLAPNSEESEQPRQEKNSVARKKRRDGKGKAAGAGVPFVFLLSLARVERTPLQTELEVRHA